MNEIIPTVVPKSLVDVEASVVRYGAHARTIHIDATDGDFAFPTTWLPGADERLPIQEGLSYEAHVMARDARSCGERFARAGAWRIIAHVETLGTTDDARNTFALWRLAGAGEAAAAVLIDTPLNMVEPLADDLHALHLMSVAKIGAQGQQLDERIYDRVAEARRRFPGLTIAVDGGVTLENIAALRDAGASRFCVGAALASASDVSSAYHTLATALGAVE